MKFLKTRAFGWLWRCVLATLLLLLIAGVLAPFVNASILAGHIQRALEASLNRRVTFSSVHLSLFSGPGFSLSDVSIEEDPRFGLEPFASVPTLNARLRLDAFLKGHVAFSSLRLVDPSLNLVKRGDGSWNVLELVSRLTAPSTLPIDLFPVFSVSSGRLNFKFGERKTTLYIADADLSVYPERSGKLYVQFSGAPARTDRPANGFGHLHGTVNWYRQPRSAAENQIEADLTLDPSNVSELSTLFEGQDAGVHGTIASHALIEGPLAALRVRGNLRLQDVRRWDLLPSGSSDWNVPYGGEINATDQSLVLRTNSEEKSDKKTAALQMRVNNFLRQPAWSLIATLNNAPAAQLLPLGRRMGLPIPSDFTMEGTVSGAVGYSEPAGFSGLVELKQVSAGLPNLPALKADSLVARISREAVQFDPVAVQTEASGSMLVGGEYNSALRKLSVSVEPEAFPVAALKGTVGDWFGMPPAMLGLRSGAITGRLDFVHAGDDQPQWAGQLKFRNAELQVPGLSEPLKNALGQIRFSTDTVDLDRISGEFGSTSLSFSYRSNSYHSNEASPARTAQRLHVAIASADLHDIEAALAPAMHADGVFERLGVSPRRVPAWLANRRLQGDLSIQRFSINGSALGALRARLDWTGVDIAVPALGLTLADGSVNGSGALDLSGSTPRYQFTASLNSLRWHGGVLNAEGKFETFGLGTDAIRNLRAEGTFTGAAIILSVDDAFSRVSGDFKLSFADGWPDLKIQHLEASESDENWSGSAATRNDGGLIVDLEREGRQRHVVSMLQEASPAISFAAHPKSGASPYEAVR